jgi:hypothetical protein
MGAVIVALLVLGLAGFALERNHARHRPWGRLAGSVDVEDRDLERLRCELRAVLDRVELADRQEPGQAHEVRAARADRG